MTSGTAQAQENASPQVKPVAEEVQGLKERVKKLEEPATINSGDTAWMLTSTGLVLLMVPGLALFYGGMVRRKNILGTMMQSMICLSLVGLQWLLFGYALAFGTTRGGVIGWDSKLLGLSGILPGEHFAGTSIPIFVHCMYQGM
ncbi:MAG TPA: ammonium transporter, partial [Gemmataceae bacterium]|nr:ammonium transporter [Gemmataceae bacterium]